VKILFVSDIVGSSGRRAVGSMLGALRSRLNVDFVVANGENAAGGFGITSKVGAELFDHGVDVITLGNHGFAKRDSFSYLNSEARVIRPANYPPGAPGRGWGMYEAAGVKIAVVNLQGRVFMAPIDCPFRAADAFIADCDEAPVRIIDMHAEATSEKIALAAYVDGRVSGVVGTHTHVQTSDERVLPGGAAYITDAGMTGVHDSVLGMNTPNVINRFLTQMQGKISLAEGAATLQGVVIDIDESIGKTRGIERVSVREGK
jgi:2',3'-cyclic-nucleotide 2'-phosphodiesterase